MPTHSLNGNDNGKKRTMITAIVLEEFAIWVGCNHKTVTSADEQARYGMNTLYFLTSGSTN